MASSHWKNRQRLDALKNVPCQDCGQMFPPECMDFDHRDPALKRFSIGDQVARNYDSILLETAKCDIICSNCHRIRTRRRRAK